MKTQKTPEKRNSIQNAVGYMVMTGFFVLLQLLWIILSFLKLRQQYAWVTGIISILALTISLAICSSHMTESIKVRWIIIILAAPFLGLLLFALFEWNVFANARSRRFREIDAQLLPFLPDNGDVLERMAQKDRSAANLFAYLKNTLGYPVYNKTRVRYYADAAEAVADQVRDLNKAEKFIFMEYYAVEEGASFEPIKEVLARKVREGVEVRFFYDEVGSIGFINRKFIKRMEELGIQCRVFNPIVPFLDMFMNNRDHRKITVIDGRVGYTGGYNLADEYFNLTHPYGQWKDSGVRLEGDAVRTLTMLFLEMWNAIKVTDQDDANFDRYFPDDTALPAGEGFIQPYGDTPTDTENTGESVYLNIINSAREYVYFTTPYLVFSSEMKTAFNLAAKRGVDVRIITPGVADKKIVYSMTRSYYAGIAEGGVRIFEYTPGFCHAKMCVADDSVAVCGTINLDYRSFCHDFEDAVLLYDCQAVSDMKADFDTLFPQCREVTEKYSTGRNPAMRIGQYFLRLIAPLI